MLTILGKGMGLDRARLGDWNVLRQAAEGMHGNKFRASGSQSLSNRVFTIAGTCRPLPGPVIKGRGRQRGFEAV